LFGRAEPIGPRCTVRRRTIWRTLIELYAVVGGSSRRRDELADLWPVRMGEELPVSVFHNRRGKLRPTGLQAHTVCGHYSTSWRWHRWVGENLCRQSYLALW